MRKQKFLLAYNGGKKNFAAKSLRSVSDFSFFEFFIQSKIMENNTAIF